MQGRCRGVSLVRPGRRAASLEQHTPAALRYAHGVTTTAPLASLAPVFQSFFMGGFECATHRRRDGDRIDVIAATRHDVLSGEDYRLLAEAGVRTVRDGLRWHRIETAPGIYDWSSFLPMLRSSLESGTQVIWDLCHWGVPDDIDIFSREFIARFTAFAEAAARLIQAETAAAGRSDPPLFCPVNEISFWSWVGGDTQHFHPHGEGRGPELKRQLVRASIAATAAIRQIEPRARFIQPEPIIHISADPDKPQDEDDAARHTRSQFEAWDMLAGRQAPELGGDEAILDLLGVNFYWNNEWIHEGDRTPPGHLLHRPLHTLLDELWKRYRRPIVLTETGAEDGAAVGWLGYVSAEVREAQRRGVPVLGLCLYPVMDYPGWDDGRHCPCGLIEATADWSGRTLRADLVAELAVQQRLFAMA